MADVQVGKKWMTVGRVLGFLSSRLNWDPTPRHPQASVSPHPWFRVGTHSLAGDGVVVGS
jgi:hypothetical protein